MFLHVLELLHPFARSFYKACFFGWCKSLITIDNIQCFISNAQYSNNRGSYTRTCICKVTLATETFAKVCKGGRAAIAVRC